MKPLIIIILSVLSVSTGAESISSRSADVASKLEALNGLGRSCETQLQRNGMDGSQSDECAKYLRNIQGSYLQSIGEECKRLSAWLSDKQQLIRDDPGYPPSDSDAERLATDMKAVLGTCNTDNWTSTYNYLLKPMSTIKAISELE